ncbi:restriction endonuclease [Kosakonia cowanii]|uniref:restriction endonuclease subunit S n=1 Tax=Enterobacteriaceae TaxID=543 RepID=UPI000B9736F0|nr:restriction endonuclease subunit S [Kosakonia cowanii]AST67775.1 restriction endonuclease [Kosakonia cowanii]AST69644.1 restriction endonuclease [Kosakonia cowanii]
MIVEKLITDHIDIWSSALQTRSTAGRGSNGKIDLYGIKKLRELILELAVRGKLVPQNPNDEPASELLKRIAAEKAELVKQGKIKKQKPLPEISEDEKPFELPVGWEWVTLATIGEIVGGGTPTSDNPQYWSTEGIKWLTPADLSGFKGKYISSGARDITAAGLASSSAKLMPKGTVLFSSRAPIGYVAISNAELSTNQGFKSCVPYIKESAEYIYYFLLSAAKKIDEMANGTTFKEVSGAIVSKVLLPLPPLNEQLKIVEVTDDLMVLCDQLEQQSLNSLNAHQQLVETLLATLNNSQNADELSENWARISQHFDTLFTTEASIDALKQTILQLAVMGKLVPQDPNDESASNLLERISAEKKLLIKQKAIKKSQLMLPIDELDLPFDLPLGWQWIQLGDVCYVIADGPHFSPKYVDKNEGVAFLSARNISVESIDLTTAKYVSREDHENFCKRVRIRKGDILYTKGGTTGIAKVNDIDTEFSVWVHVAVLQIPLDKVFNEYLALTLNSPHCYEQSQKYTHGIGNKDLGLTRMINITIPLPPISEQYRIVTKANQLLALCDTLKSRLQSALQTQLQLADALTDAALN